MVKTAFPKAEIVADRFHALRLAIYALEQIRKEVQKNFHTKRRKYFKHARTLLIKHKENLEPEELEQVSNMLTPSKELALKKLAYDRFASPDIYTAKKRLLAFIHGVDILDTNIWWFGGGSAAPAIELIYIFCKKLGIELEADMEAVGEIRKRLKAARESLADYDLHKDKMQRDFDPLHDTLPVEIDTLFDSAIAAAKSGDEESLLNEIGRAHV